MHHTVLSSSRCTCPIRQEAGPKCDGTEVTFLPLNESPSTGRTAIYLLVNGCTQCTYSVFEYSHFDSPNLRCPLVENLPQRTGLFDTFCLSFGDQKMTKERHRTCCFTQVAVI